jgi:hypothetical protein
MGSEGIKRRKPKQPLPRLKGSRFAEPSEPPIMWPEAGSGFEADPFSPAGQAQMRWNLFDTLHRRSVHRSRAQQAMRWLIWCLLGIGAVAMVMGVVSSLVH